MSPIIHAAELGGDFEEKPVREGKYPLRIVKSEFGQSKKGNDMISLTIKIEGPDSDGAALLNHWLTVPEEGDQYYRMRMRDLTRFFRLFGVDIARDFDFEKDAETLTGLTADCFLTQEESDDGIIRNRLKLPRFA